MKNGSYEFVIPPDDYPGKRYRGKYAYEHHVVWWQNTGDVVKQGFVVHHKNEQKRDNRFENLELKSKGEHSAEHQRERSAGFIDVTCVFCKNYFSTRLKLLEQKLKNKQTNFFCSRSCQIRQQWLDRKTNFLGC